MEIADCLPSTNVMDLLLDAVCVVDVEGRYLYVNTAFEQIFGYAPAEILGRRMVELILPEDRARTLDMAAGIMAGQPVRNFENRYVRKDGQIVHIMWSARWSEADQARIAVARDVTELRRSEAMQMALHTISNVANSSEDLASLFRQIHKILNELMPVASFLVAFYDQKTRAFSFPYYSDLRGEVGPPQGCATDSFLAEVVRTGQVLLVSPEDHENVPESQQAHREQRAFSWLGVPLQGQVDIVGALAIQCDLTDLRYSSGDVDLVQFVATQVATAILRKQMLDRLQHSALHDQLTDLPNRKLFHDRLQTAMALARRDQMRLALLYLDLDLFKQVNDTYGHATGDLLLQEVAMRLRKCVRDSDTVGRIGGDEFLLMLNGINSPLDAQLVAEKVTSALCLPFNMAGQQLLISPSIGIALYPEHANDHLELIQNADQAMYRAKKAGGNTFHMA